MKNKNLLIGLIVVAALTGFHCLLFIRDAFFISVYLDIVRPLLYVAAAVTLLFLWGGRFSERKVKNNTFLICAIVSALYILLLLISGVVGGFAKNAMAASFSTALKNLWQYATVFISMEYIRLVLIRRTPQKHNGWFGLLMSLAFAFIQIDNLAYIFKDSNVAEVIAIAIIPALIINFYITYAADSGTFWGLAIFRTAVTILPVIIPVLPNINKFLHVIMLCGVALAGYILLDIYRFEQRQKTIKKKEKYRWKWYLAPAAVLAVLIIFGLGILPVAPVAVKSDSMKSQFERGSVVVVQKLTPEKALERIEVGDVIQYNNGRISIVHRVIEIRENELGEILFITKGDDNPVADARPVYAEQITGVAKFSVPYIGYPAVWLSELFGR